MGNSSSSAFAGVFTAVESLSQDDVTAILADYKEKKLDFGVRVEDIQGLLSKFAKEDVAALAAVFDSGNATINALDFICGLGICCKGNTADKVNFVFDAYDFDEPKGQVSADELEILIISALNGLTKMTGKGTVPDNNAVELLSTKAYKKADKDRSGAITRDEFRAFVFGELDTNEDATVSADEVLAKFAPGSADAAPAAAGAGGDAEEVDEAAIPIAHEYPSIPDDTNSLLKQHLTKEVYEELKDKKTSLGVDLYSVIKVGVQAPKCKVGVLAQDEESYTVFAPLMDKVVEGYHVGYSLSEGHKRDLDPSHLGDAATNPDPEGKFINSTRIRVARNLKGYPLPGSVTKEQRKEIESKIVEALKSLEGDLAGEYYPLDTMDDATRERLEQDHFLFRKEHGYFAFGGVYRDWGEGRGIFHNAAKTFLVWVNEEDEMRIISMQPGGDVGAVFARLSEGVAALEKKLDFIFDDKRGYIASCPSNIGTGMRASVHINLPLASKDPRMKAICDELYLQPRGAHGEHSEAGAGGVFDISPYKRLGLTEVECAQALHQGASRLIALEKELQAAAGSA